MRPASAIRILATRAAAHEGARHARSRHRNRPRARQDEPARRPGGGLARRLAPIFDSEWSGWLPTYAFAVEHPDGVILVDSGANASLKRLPRWHPYFRLAVKFDIEPEQEAGAQLRGLGIASSDVKLIVLTHLHIDHDGGLAAFPHARVLVSAGERAAAAGLAGRLNGYLPQRWPKSFDPEPLVFADAPFGPFARSRRLTADGALTALPTPGHTPDQCRSSSMTASDASSSSATPPTARTICSPAASTGSAPTRRRRATRWRGSPRSPPSGRPCCRRPTIPARPVAWRAARRADRRRGDARRVSAPKPTQARLATPGAPC